MEVIKSSNVSVTENIPLTKLQKYTNTDIFVAVVSVIKSIKSTLWLNEGVYEEPSVSPTYDTSKKRYVI